jgi:hypothetical protein
MNAKVGAENEGMEQIVGTDGLDKINENGELFTESCASQVLVTGAQ